MYEFFKCYLITGGRKNVRVKIEEDNIIKVRISASQIAIRQLRFHATSKDIMTLLHYVERRYAAL